VTNCCADMPERIASASLGPTPLKDRFKGMHGDLFGGDSAFTLTTPSAQQDNNDAEAAISSRSTAVTNCCADMPERIASASLGPTPLTLISSD
jgi:hypothetical protein